MPSVNIQTSKSSLALHLPKPILAAPTKTFRNIKERTERFNGRQDLNLLLIKVAVINRTTAVIQRSPKSSIRRIKKLVNPVNLGLSISAKN